MKITVIGCGWLGLPLSENLISNGYCVYGSTTSFSKLNSLVSKGIHAFIYSAENEFTIDDRAKDSEIVIVNFPPSKSDDYAKQVEELLNQFSADTKVIFTSSTSVYEEVDAIVDEKGRVNEDHPVRLAEKIVLSSNRHYCILRLSGLIGSGRHPIHFLQGRENLNGGNVPVNLVHLKDVIEAIGAIITRNKWSCIYNVSYPSHPNKKVYYPMMAELFGLKAPIYMEDNTKGKEIDGNLLTIQLDFGYANPIDSAI
jgi:nucleoside-diphosphate-sugar epimerase